MVGEELTLETEDNNEHDEHAVAVMKDGYIILLGMCHIHCKGILVFLEAWWQNNMSHYRKEEARNWL